MSAPRRVKRRLRREEKKIETLPRTVIVAQREPDLHWSGRPLRGPAIRTNVTGDISASRGGIWRVAIVL
ncbi:MAG: hypothetical protein C3F11_12470 [Methylocystaceae bacterium]|nr:MAG: hypothetical protein C3F11_12470 [Methylocystaceae bacterium]